MPEWLITVHVCLNQRLSAGHLNTTRVKLSGLMVLPLLLCVLTFAGQPPKRFRQNGDENVHSLRAVLRNPKSFMGRATSKLRKSRKSTDSVEEESHSPDAKSVDHMV